METTIKSLKEDIATLQKNFNKLKFAITNLEKQNRTLKSEVNRLNSIVATLSRKL